MIGNPIVVKKSGGGQVYRITDTIFAAAPTSAEAGERIQFSVDGPPAAYIIKDSSGLTVPVTASGTTTVVITFIMPASNVTISELGTATITPVPGGDDIIIAS